MVELNSNVRDVQKVVTEIRSRVDRITNFPELAEDPQVEQITFREAAIRVAVMGPDSSDPNAEIKLREVTEQIRDELLELGEVSQANIQGAKPFQIDVEVSEDTLRRTRADAHHGRADLVGRTSRCPGGSSRQTVKRFCYEVRIGAKLERNSNIFPS